MGATQASAGVLAPYIEADESKAVFFELTVRSLGLYDEFIENVVADAGVPVIYHRNGTLQVVGTTDRMAALKAVAARLDSQGVPLTLLDAHAARAEEPRLSDDIAGALLIGIHGFVGAGDLTRALVAASRKHGAQLVEGSRVHRIAPSGRDLVVETGRGSLTGNAVVIAGGSWSAQIAIEGVTGQLPVRPVRGQLLHLTWNGPALRRVIWGERCYLVPWDDGTLLVGATVEEAGFDERTTVAGVRDLLDAACELVPHTWSAGFLSARCGLRPGTPDDLPVIGRSSVLPGLMYATGHFRNGVLLAPLTARLVGDALLENRVDPAIREIGPQRFGL
jgi:glycine oxidase